MIKKLIDDLANDSITLSQALTRAKIISFRVENTTFQDWLKSEVEGYKSGDDKLPQYRRFSCELKATITNRSGDKATLPLTFSENAQLMQELSFANIHESIPALEENYKHIASEFCTFQFPSSVTKNFNNEFRKKNPFYNLISVGQEFDKFKIKNIIDLTKQKLLDTLLELNKVFPDLDDDFKMNDKKSDKVQNIVTTNIYGSNNPVNVAAGESVEQKGFNFNMTANYSELENLGVEKSQIEELKKIISENNHDKPTLGAKAIKWLGTVAASVASKNLAEHIPAITDFVHNLIS